jgi:ABC-2 type transport system permease protein
MNGLFAAFDVDFLQWKALVLATLKTGFRQSSMGRTRMRGEVKGITILITQAIVYSMYGAFMALFIWAAGDIFFGALVAMSYTMFVVSTTVLLDYNSAVTSPDDYSILGFRPISSRTYFAAKLANVLIYTTAMTSVLAYLPTVSFFLKYGVGAGLAGLSAFYVCSVTVALAILSGYAWLMGAVGPDRLKKVLSYLQLIMSFFVYGGFFMLRAVMTNGALGNFQLHKSWWLALYPASWYASFLELSIGRHTAIELVPAGLAVAAVVALAAGLGGRLSLDYSEHLAATINAATAASDKTRRSSSASLWFRTGESRAMSVLVKSQFKNNNRFRMTILTILPITVLYLLMGIVDGHLSDPFVVTHNRRGPDGMTFISVAIMVFPQLLKAAISRSEAFRASWIFFASPVDRAKLIRAASNVLVATFLVPYLIVIAAVLIYFVGAPVHVLIHITLMGLLSYFALQLYVLIDPAVPFSQPLTAGRRSTSFFIVFGIIGGAAYSLPVIARFIYVSPLRTVIAFAVVIIAGVFVDSALRARVAAQARDMEFLG